MKAGDSAVPLVARLVFLEVTPFAKFSVAYPYVTNFKKHASQPAHRRAMDFISGKSLDAECVPDVGVCICAGEH